MDEHLTQYFAELDADFVNIPADLSDEVFVFNGTGVTVQKSYELPLPVVLPGSEVIFEFGTEGGDISFGVLFMPQPDETEGQQHGPQHEEREQEAELILAMERVDSSMTTRSGTFKAPGRFGTLYFVWDNSHAWVPKELSYAITMTQATFSLIDEARCAKAMESLERAQRKGRRLQRKLTHMEGYVNGEVGPKLQKLQGEYDELQRLLQHHNEKLRIASRQSSHYTSQIAVYGKIELGLLMRSLDHRLLRNVLSFLWPLAAKELLLCSPNPHETLKATYPRATRQNFTRVCEVCRRWCFVADFDSAAPITTIGAPPPSPAVAASTAVAHVTDGMSHVSVHEHDASPPAEKKIDINTQDQRDSGALFVPFPTKPWGLRGSTPAPTPAFTGAPLPDPVLVPMPTPIDSVRLSDNGAGEGLDDGLSQVSKSSWETMSASSVHSGRSSTQHSQRSSYHDHQYPVMQGKGTLPGPLLGLGDQEQEQCTGDGCTSKSQKVSQFIPVAESMPRHRQHQHHHHHHSGQKESPGGRDSASQSQAESQCTSASASASATGSLSASTRSRAARDHSHRKHNSQDEDQKRLEHSKSKAPHDGQHSAEQAASDKTYSTDKAIRKLEKLSEKAKSKVNMRVAMRTRISHKLAAEKEDMQKRVTHVDELARKRVKLKKHIVSLENEFVAKYGRRATTREMRHFGADTYQDLQSCQVSLRKEERGIHFLVENYKDTKRMLASLVGKDGGQSVPSKSSKEGRRR